MSRERRIFSQSTSLQSDGSFRLIDPEPADYQLSIGITEPEKQLTSYAVQTTLGAATLDRRTGHSPIEIGEIPVHRLAQE